MSFKSAFAQGRFESVRLKNGAIIDASCFQMIKLRLKKDPQEFTDLMQKNFLRSERRLQTCQKNYPELSSYFKEWKEKSKKITFACYGKGMATEESSELYQRCFIQNPDNRELCQSYIRAGGQSYYEAQGVKKIFPHDISSRLLKGISSSKSLMAQGKYIVGMSETWVNSFFNDVEDDDISTLIHEVLHFTKANNRFDHSEIEVKQVDDYLLAEESTDPKVCQENIIYDRINVLTALCTQAPLHGSHHTLFPAALWKTFKFCPNKKICEELFTTKIKNVPHLSKPLSSSDAQSLCSRILFEGSCQSFLASKAGQKFLFNLPVLAQNTQKIIETIDPYIPKSPHQIPSKLMNWVISQTQVSPDLIKNDVCLKNLLYQSKDDHHWYFSPHLSPAKELKRYQDEKERWDRFSVKDQTSQMFDKAIEAIKDHPKCQDYNHAVKVSSFLYQARDRINKLIESDIIRNIRLRIVNGEIEDSVQISHDPKSFRGESNKILREILGAKLYDHYIKTLEHHHPLGKKYSCLNSSQYAAGIFEHYKALLIKENKPTCPAF